MAAIRIVSGNNCVVQDTPEWYFCIISQEYRMFSFHHVTWDAEANHDMDWFIVPAWLDLMCYNGETERS